MLRVLSKRRMHHAKFKINTGGVDEVNTVPLVVIEIVHFQAS